MFASILGWSSWGGRLELLVQTLGDGDGANEYKSRFGCICNQLLGDEKLFWLKSEGIKPINRNELRESNVEGRKSTALMFGDGVEVLQLL